MAIGAQMKLAHKLKSADHINRVRGMERRGKCVWGPGGYQ